MTDPDLRQALAHAFLDFWAADLDADDAAFIRSDDESRGVALKYADAILPVVAARVAEVERERDECAEAAAVNAARSRALVALRDRYRRAYADAPESRRSCPCVGCQIARAALGEAREES